MKAQLRRLGLALVVFSMATGCDIQPDVSEGPSDLPATRYTTVNIEYRQPNQCANAAPACSERVVFFGSWMNPGQGLPLDPAPGHMWVGQATNVPVNWPPVIAPHLVRVYDPHLVRTDTSGRAALRLRVGGQILTHYENLGTAQEAGRVHVDDNGFGHNPL
jgi:hypothetical protein